jgi:hypothetical protein
MARRILSVFGVVGRIVSIFIIVGILLSVVFVAYKGSQPMAIKDANGMTYWQFMSDRIKVIRELPAKCQQLYITGYALAVPFYPALYTFEGLFPDNSLTQHTQPDPAIPKNIHGYEVPDTWWSLVETISWQAWVTPHLPTIMPECNLKAPTNPGT